MTGNLRERRRTNLLTLVVAAGILVAAAAVTTAIDIRSSRPELVSGAVIPNLEEAISDAQRITVVSTEVSYRIERVERSTGAVWVMRDRGDYPVRSDRVDQLTSGLSHLVRTRRMTNDPAKHERIGVGDPREGGRGVLVQVEDARGALLVNLILGIEPSGGLYARQSGDNQAYAVSGELPPLRDASTWLDLAPIALSPDALRRVEIMPSEGRAYILARDSVEQAWRIAVPALASNATSAVADTALRLTQIAPTDVQAAPAVQGMVRARLRAHTETGLMIDGEVIESGGQMWLKLVARAETPEQEAAALEINNRVSAWAYMLRDVEARALTPPLADLIGG
ncbi:MAG: DUF4340 domain-containing protein [Hyphomonadaceae bacterium]|nr:DUF4340 domain-containing protein [Hyphomonadaceae bacterium]